MLITSDIPMRMWYLQPCVFSYTVILHHYAQPYKISCAEPRFPPWLWHITLLFIMFPKLAAMWEFWLLTPYVGHSASKPIPVARGQIYKKVREQLSLKCQILWPELWWNRKIAKQIDTLPWYLDKVWKMEQRRGGAFRSPIGHMKSKWHVPDFSGSGNQKAANVRFCIQFNKLGIGNTREVNVSKKVSDKKGVKRKVKENQHPTLLICYTHLGSKNKTKKKGKKREAICRLHCQSDINPFFLDKIHDISAH